MTSRAIPAAPITAPAEPGWMTTFLASLARDDLAPATLRGYRYDLRHFLAWHRTIQDSPFTIEGLAEYELIAYRQHMVAAGRRPATVNRRLDALRRLCRWARGAGSLSTEVARDLRPVRTMRNRQPAGPTDAEAYALLRAAGARAMAWPGATTPWCSLCCGPGCGWARWRPCRSPISLCTIVPAACAFAMVSGSRPAKCR